MLANGKAGIMEKDNGGPAFPRVPGPFVPGEGVAWDGFDGMSLRDYFAGMALSGMINDEIIGGYGDFAKSAYALADAMILERSK
jgi:hypothetical protein